MSKATAAITDRFKNTFVKTRGVDTTEIQRAFFQMGFYFGEATPKLKREVFRPSAWSYLRVDRDGSIWRSEYMDDPSCVTEYCREVLPSQILDAAEQVRKVKRDESKASKKRKALRKWAATATPRTTEVCPVRENVIVSVRLNDGTTYTREAGKFDWTTGLQGYRMRDIASYKVLTPNKHKPVTLEAMATDIADSIGKGSVLVERGTPAEILDAANNVIGFTRVTEQPDTNPKKQYGVASVPLNMWSPLASAYGALGLYNGSLKYGKANFANTPVEASIYIAAAMRHLLAWASGQEDDPADGVPNLGGVLANVAILLESRAAGMLIDDRLLMSGYLKELEMLKEKVKYLNELHAGKNPRHYTRDQT